MHRAPLALSPVAHARHAKETEADLIVLGAHDHGLMHDTFVGSTAARILSDSHCCMLVVRD
ncbi:MAG: universal stress protein [Myxococcota bacterium]